MIGIKRACIQCIKFWLIVLIGNFIGALLMGLMLDGSFIFHESENERLQEIIDKKLSHKDKGTEGWFSAILSGMVGNWLVGMAAFFASSGISIPGKFIGLALPVLTFVTLGVQHSPANMGYFGIALTSRHDNQIDITWSDAILWNIIPAAIGNIFGAAIFVAMLMYYCHIHGHNLNN